MNKLKFFDLGLSEYGETWEKQELLICPVAKTAAAG